MMRDVKWQKHRDSVEKWKNKNREYYLMQKRQLASRPEYLAKRREMYQLRKNDEKLILSTNKSDDSERSENIFGCPDPRQCPT